MATRSHQAAAWQAWLIEHLGEPDREEHADDGASWRWGSLAVVVTGKKIGNVFSFANNTGGGLAFLIEFEQLRTTVADAERWLDDHKHDNATASGAATTSARKPKDTAAPSAAKFDAIYDTATDDDGRIARYLADRGLPTELAQHLRLARLDDGRSALAAFASSASETLAVQVLALDAEGKPQTDAVGKKMRRTFASVRGWAASSAWYVAAVAGGDVVEVAMVEGVEDGLALRTAGWCGPIAAVLGKGNLAKHAPACQRVLLVPDGDVSADQVQAYIDFHCLANRAVRVATLPEELDPNDMVIAGRGAELLELLQAAPAGELSKVARVEAALAAFRFTKAGDDQFAVGVRELAKALGVTVEHLRKKRAEAKAEDTKAKARQAYDELLARLQAAGTGIDGEKLLDDVLAFLRRFIAYPSTHAAHAHALWNAHAHAMEAWSSTPRIAFLSPEPGSGKSRALEVTELLVPRPVPSINVSVAYLFRAIADETGRATVLYDEIDTLFGSHKSDKNEEIRGLLNAGHRRHSTTGRCEKQSDRIVRVEFPAYAAVALAGLGSLPATIFDRSIAIRMRKRDRAEIAEPFRMRDESSAGHALRDQLAAWASVHETRLADARPELPAGIEDRNADVWEPLIAVAVADAAGGDWPTRARAAALSFLSGREESASLGVRLLADLRLIFANRSAMHTDTILTTLNDGDFDGPWGELRREQGLNARGLSRLLHPYGVKPRDVKLNGVNRKGYLADDLADAWRRYLPDKPPGETPEPPPTGGANSAPEESATSATSATSPGNEVADGSTVADASATASASATSPRPISSAGSACSAFLGAGAASLPPEPSKRRPDLRPSTPAARPQAKVIPEPATAPAPAPWPPGTALADLPNDTAALEGGPAPMPAKMDAVLAGQAATTPTKQRAKREPKSKALKAPPPIGDDWRQFLAKLGVTVRLVTDHAQALELTRDLIDYTGPVAIDIETAAADRAGATGLDPDARPRLVQLYAGGDEVLVVDLDATGVDVLELLGHRRCIAYGATFEARVLVRHGVEPDLDDAAIAAGLRLDRDEWRNDLASVASRVTNLSVPDKKAKAAMQRSDWRGELHLEQIAYAAADAVMTLEVWNATAHERDNAPRAYEAARGAVAATARMELAGMPVDWNVHAAIAEQWGALHQVEGTKFRELSGFEPTQRQAFALALGRWFTPAQLEAWPRSTISGRPSLSSKMLVNSEYGKAPVIAQYLRVKSMSTLVSTFGAPLVKRRDPTTGRLHGGFRIAGARSGRYTSSPNLQNEPRGAFRRIHDAGPGRCIIGVDYAAVELRVAALIAGEQSLLDVFRHAPDTLEGDPHGALAAHLNVSRALAKSLNFGLLYGMQAPGFAVYAGVSEEDAEQHLEGWRGVRRAFVRWQERTRRAALKSGVVSTVLGRRVSCYDTVNGGRFFRGNRALAVPISGSAAEAMLIAIHIADKRLREERLDARLVATVHDELVADAAQADAERCGEILLAAMRHAFAQVFNTFDRFDDAALYIANKAEIARCWKGAPLELTALTDDERVQLFRHLDQQDEHAVDDDEEGADHDLEHDEVPGPKAEGR
jgi:DNA polymerase I-like protein with 3'-5' exonuclease and polymerase domains